MLFQQDIAIMINMLEGKTVTQILPPLRIFGFWTATCLVLGNMIGTGVFLLPASLASIGPIGIVGWVVTAIGAISLALVFAKLSHIFPKAGGPYAYARDAFGDFTGFMVAWGYWSAIWTGNAAISLAFASYISHFSPLLESKFAILGIALAILWITTGLNTLGMKYGGRIQVTTVIMKLIPLILVGFVGVFYIDYVHFKPFNLSAVSDFSAINSAAALTMWAFIGLESATVPADEVKDPATTIPRATIAGTLIGAILYILTTFVLFGVVGPANLATSQAPFVACTEMLFGSAITPLVGLCVLSSIFGGLNGWVLLQGQVPLALAHDGLFPKAFSVTRDDGTPVRGLVFSSILVSLLLFATLSDNLIETFNTIISIGAVMTLIAYLFAGFAASIAIRSCAFKSEQTSKSFWVAIVLGLVFSLWAISGVGVSILALCLGGYIIGIPIYWFVKHEQKKVLDA